MILRLALLILLPVFAAIAFFAVYFSFYGGGYSAPPEVELPVDQLLPPPTIASVTSESPVVLVRKGLLVVDAQHANNFAEEEIVSLTSKVASRGFDVEFAGDFTPLLDPSLGEPRYHWLASKLRRADSYAVILPRAPFSDREALLIKDFVEKGGKLLLIGDPGRLHGIDSIAERFGVEFQEDYLYNTQEYDGNFRHIFVSDFQPDELTAGLGTVALYMAGSLRSTGPGLAFTGSNTKSSLQEGAEGLSPISRGEDRNVLAIADFTFLVPPHDTVLDNDRLLSNIADFITDSERLYELTDFPYFFDDAEQDGVDIVISQPALLNSGLKVKSGLETYGVSSELTSVEDLGRNTVFLGLHEDATQVEQYLQAAGVRLDDTLGAAFALELELARTGVLVLDHGQDDRYVLIVLADTPETLAATVAGLVSGEYRGGLVSDFVGVQKFAGVSE